MKYCYAKDKTNFEAWQCVNCKTRYPIEKYNLNGTCYDKIQLEFFINHNLEHNYHYLEV